MSYDGLLMLVFFFLSFQLRNIPSEFSIQNELFIVMFIYLLKIVFFTLALVALVNDKSVKKKDDLDRDEFSFWILNHSRYLYVETIFDMFIMLESGIRQIYKTYQPNEIVPYPLNEDCIYDFELASIHPTSFNYFYRYLDNLDDFWEPLIAFGLHSDILYYNNMIENECDLAEIHEKAVEIFEEYIIENCKWQLDAEAQA